MIFNHPRRARDAQPPQPVIEPARAERLAAAYAELTLGKTDAEIDAICDRIDGIIRAP